MRQSTEPVRFFEAGLVDYVTAWDRQRGLAADRAAGTGTDTVLLLEHPSVYTAGRRTRIEDRPTDGTPVVEVDRGGLITWHGPGQLVGYPVVALAQAVGVRGYVRMLEQVLISTCAEFGLATGRVRGRNGVWVSGDRTRPERKIAAIGVRIAHRITTHGFALNCDPDLAAFDRIVPCGIRDAGVTSLSAELGRTVPVADVIPVVRRYLADGLDGRLPVREDDLRTGALPPGVSWHLDPALAVG